jgi:hypothetical protein
MVIDESSTELIYGKPIDSPIWLPEEVLLAYFPLLVVHKYFLGVSV